MKKNKQDYRRWLILMILLALGTCLVIALGYRDSFMRRGEELSIAFLDEEIIKMFSGNEQIVKYLENSAESVEFLKSQPEFTDYLAENQHIAEGILKCEDPQKAGLEVFQQFQAKPKE